LGGGDRSADADGAAAGLRFVRLLTVDARALGRDRAALARLVESAQVDLACVHNGPHLLRWRTICAAIGRRSGLPVVTGGRTAGANLLLSGLGIDVLATRDLCVGSRRRPAGAALAALRQGESRFVLVATTLAGAAAARAAQAAQIIAAAATLVPDDLPVIVGAPGVAPDSAAWRTLAAGREVVAGRLFADRRLAVSDPDGATGSPAVVVRIDV
jgi:endonuclease/exonuclease/phosphatase family metal-dependent hydrolase